MRARELGPQHLFQAVAVSTFDRGRPTITVGNLVAFRRDRDGIRIWLGLGYSPDQLVIDASLDAEVALTPKAEHRPIHFGQ